MTMRQSLLPYSSDLGPLAIEHLDKPSCYTTCWPKRFLSDIFAEVTFYANDTLKVFLAIEQTDTAVSHHIYPGI